MKNSLKYPLPLDKHVDHWRSLKTTLHAEIESAPLNRIRQLAISFDCLSRSIVFASIRERKPNTPIIAAIDAVHMQEDFERRVETKDPTIAPILRDVARRFERILK